MKLNEAIIKIRVELQSKELKQSGKNTFAGFKYFELSDFLPTLNKLMCENGVNDVFTIENNEAILTLKKDDEVNTYKMPFVMFDVPKNKNGTDSMQQIQYLGALNTYYKRYLYLNAFGITDGDIIDALDNNNSNNIPKVDYIDSDQIQLIKDLIEKTNSDLVKFLGVFHITKLEDMPKQHFNKAIDALNKKLGA